MNIKRIIGKLDEVVVGSEVVVKLNTRSYRVMVVNLLDLAPPPKKKMVPKEKRSEKVCHHVSICIIQCVCLFVCSRFR